jgi:CBS domain-containing protein
MTATSPELMTGTVGEAMTPGILTCLPVTPLSAVAQMMATHRPPNATPGPSRWR